MGSQPSKSRKSERRKLKPGFGTGVVLKLQKTAKHKPEQQPTVKKKQNTADEKNPANSEPRTTTASETRRRGAVATSNVSPNSSPIPGPGSVEHKRKLSVSNSWELIVAQIKIGSDFLSV